MLKKLCKPVVFNLGVVNHFWRGRDKLRTQGSLGYVGCYNGSRYENGCKPLL